MPPPVDSSTFTAGAVPIKNDKGEITMAKVKVTRYVTGKKPAFAEKEYQTDSESDSDDFIVVGRPPSSYQPPALSEPGTSVKNEDEDAILNDPRLLRSRRIRQESEEQDEETDRSHRYNRSVAEPEILHRVESTSADDQEMDIAQDDAEDDEDAIARKRALLRQRAQERLKEEVAAHDVKMEEDDEEEGSDEYEDESDDDHMFPRLKPVFVKKEDRATIKTAEDEERERKEEEKRAKKEAEVRKAEARKLIEAEIKREMQEQLQKKESLLEDSNFEIPIVKDDEDPEAEYEAWKVRELTRLKRDRDEKEAFDAQQRELDRLRNLTEEERQAELAKNPKQVTNKAAKGKMKFLQKYYHRGVFYLDKEEEIFKRDYTAPTLEDHHDKSVLPKVMQVKNFGRAGRTKYTHLVDQDTTKFDAAWSEQSALNVKFYAGKAGGTKQVFDRPSAKRHKPS